MCSARAGEAKAKPTAVHDSHVARRMSFLPVLFSARLSRVQPGLQAAAEVRSRLAAEPAVRASAADDAGCRNDDASRLDVKTGEVKEWPSPSGPKSEPYGIVFTKARSGTRRRRQSRTRSSASIPRPGNSRAGPFPAGATLCAIWM